MKPDTPYVDELAGLLVESLSNSAFQNVASGCVQTLLISSFTSEVGKALTIKTIPQMVSLATEDGYPFSDADESNGDSPATSPQVNLVPKLVIEILVNFSKSLQSSPSQLESLLAITVPLLLWFSDEENSSIPIAQRNKFVNSKLLELVACDSAVFKKLLQHGLSEWQREMVEYIMLATSGQSSGSGGARQGALEAEADPETHIQLKSFA